MKKINKAAAIIVVLALIILLIGLFLSKNLDSSRVIDKRVGQDTQPNVMTITVRKADNTTETVEVNMPMILTAQE